MQRKLACMRIIEIVVVLKARYKVNAGSRHLYTNYTISALQKDKHSQIRYRDAPDI